MTRNLHLFHCFVFLVFSSLSCNDDKVQMDDGERAAQSPAPTSAVQVTAAMRNVMWKGELGAKIRLDTISDREGLTGVGPLTGLRGELMIVDGESYVSRVTGDGAMRVERTYDAGAPFFVRANIREWREVALPADVKTIPELQRFVDERTEDDARPFALKIEGRIESATIHVQNLPEGTRVSSPKEAHSGQVKYRLGPGAATIVGFFSTEHQGVFTHHDTFLHLHLLTGDGAMMGHLDEVVLGGGKVYFGVG